MKTLLAFLALSAITLGVPPIRITNREYPDGSGSSKEIDPAKRESTETFYDPSRKQTSKVVCKLDDRLQPLSGIYYNAKGTVYQKCAYKLDGEDRIIQEVIYDAQGRLLGTKNYHYGTRNGRAVVVTVDTYDSNGNLIQTPRQAKPAKKGR